MLDRLREGVEAFAYADPRAMLRDQPVAVRGTVVDVWDGPSFTSKSEPFATRDRSVVVAVRVREVFKDQESLIRGDRVYVSLPRGVTGLDEFGEVAPNDAAVPVSDVRRSLPAGLEVVVVARARDDRELLTSPAVTRDKWTQPLPEGETLLSGMHPQAFVTDQGEQPLSSWPTLTFVDLVQQLRDERAVGKR